MLLVPFLAWAACGHGVGQRMPVEIRITASAASIALGLTASLTAVARYADGSLENATNLVAWTSSDPGVLTVARFGNEAVIESHSVGAATVVASWLRGGVAGSLRLQVVGPVLASLAITPSSPAIALGTSQDFVATGTLTDLSVLDLTSSVVWASTTPAVASIDPSGRCSGLAVGVTTITASMGGVVDTTTLTVTPAVLTSIAVTPTLPSIALGTKQVFTATGFFSDTTVQDLTTSVAWTSSSPAIATIDAGGLAPSLSVAATTATPTHARSRTLRATSRTLSPAVLVSLAIGPDAPTIALGTKQQFTATGTFSDSTTQDLTSSVSWLSASTAVATVASSGLASSVAIGTSMITARHDATGVFDTTLLTVSSAALVSIDVTPALPSIALGTKQQFTAIGTYSDTTTQDLTASVTWSSSVTAVATVSNAGGSVGLATSLSTGTTTITATHAATSIADTASLMVTAAVLVSLTVAPDLPWLLEGKTLQFTAIGTYSDTTTQDLTTSVTWQSSNGAAATISMAGGSEGLATGVANGTTTITATHAGTSIFDTTTLTIVSGITLRGASSASEGSGVTAITLSTPGNSVSGDVLVAAIAVRPSTATITAPVGWTLLRRVDNGSGAANSLAVYRRTVTVSEPGTHAWTLSTSTGSAGGMLSFFGVDTSSPVDPEAGQATASSLSHAAPSLTTSTPNTMLVAAFAFSSSATWSEPSGMTEAVDVASLTPPSATGISMCLDYQALPSSGATGTRTAVASNDSDTGNTVILALRRMP